METRESLKHHGLPLDLNDSVQRRGKPIRLVSFRLQELPEGDVVRLPTAYGAPLQIFFQGFLP